MTMSFPPRILASPVDLQLDSQYLFSDRSSALLEGRPAGPAGAARGAPSRGPTLLAAGRLLSGIEGELTLWLSRGVGLTLVAGGILPEKWTPPGVILSVTQIYGGAGVALIALQGAGWRAGATAGAVLAAVGASLEQDLSGGREGWTLWPGARAGVQASISLGPIELGAGAFVWGMAGAREFHARPAIDVARLPPVFGQFGLTVGYHSGVRDTPSEEAE